MKIRSVLALVVVLSLFCVVFCPVLQAATAPKTDSHHGCHGEKKQAPRQETRMLCCEQPGLAVSKFIPETGLPPAIAVEPPVPAAESLSPAWLPSSDGSLARDTGRNLAVLSTLRI